MAFGLWGGALKKEEEQPQTVLEKSFGNDVSFCGLFAALSVFFLVFCFNTSCVWVLCAPLKLRIRSLS